MRLPKPSKVEDERVSESCAVACDNFGKVLPIEKFVPPFLNDHSVKVILLCGFLKPGEVKRFFGKHYLPYEVVKRVALRKGVSFKDFKASFEWLEKIGVVMQRKHGSKNLLFSLNPDLGSVSKPGSDIIRVVVKAGQELSKRR